MRINLTKNAAKAFSGKLKVLGALASKESKVFVQFTNANNKGVCMVTHVAYPNQHNFKIVLEEQVEEDMSFACKAEDITNIFNNILLFDTEKVSIEENAKRILIKGGDKISVPLETTPFGDTEKASFINPAKATHKLKAMADCQELFKAVKFANVLKTGELSVALKFINDKLLVDACASGALTYNELKLQKALYGESEQGEELIGLSNNQLKALLCFSEYNKLVAISLTDKHMFIVSEAECLCLSLASKVHDYQALTSKILEAESSLNLSLETDSFVKAVKAITSINGNKETIHLKKNDDLKIAGKDAEIVVPVIGTTGNLTGDFGYSPVFLLDAANVFEEGNILISFKQSAKEAYTIIIKKEGEEGYLLILPVLLNK